VDDSCWRCEGFVHESDSRHESFLVSTLFVSSCSSLGMTRIDYANVFTRQYITATEVPHDVDIPGSRRRFAVHGSLHSAYWVSSEEEHLDMALLLEEPTVVGLETQVLDRDVDAKTLLVNLPCRCGRQIRQGAVAAGTSPRSQGESYGFEPTRFAAPRRCQAAACDQQRGRSS
jgi:hypothetical protein